jgi:polar amino acid transport system substrate-binding protein
MKSKGLVFLVLAVSLSLWLSPSVGLAEEKVYTNGFDADYPPFTFIDKEGKPAGFDIDGINWIAKEMGFKVKHQATDWAAIVPSLKAKKIDFIASGMSITPERQKEVQFVEPYWVVKQLLLVKQDSDLTVEKCLVDGGKVGLQRGSAESKWITENLLKKGKKFELVPYDSAPLAVEDLVNGRIPCVATSDTILKEAKDKGLAIKSIGGYGQPDVSYGYAVRKEDSELLKLLNEGLKKLKASPDWDELVKKWDMK